MTAFYSILPNTDILRSKIDVLTMPDPNDEDVSFFRVEITADNDGVFLTSCSGGAREDVSIPTKELSIAVARCILEAYGQI